MTRGQRKFLTKRLQNNVETKCYGNVSDLFLWSLTKEGNIIWVEYEKVADIDYKRLPCTDTECNAIIDSDNSLSLVKKA